MRVNIPQSLTILVHSWLIILQKNVQERYGVARGP